VGDPRGEQVEPGERAGPRVFDRRGAEDAHYLTGQVLQPNGGWVMA